MWRLSREDLIGCGISVPTLAMLTQGFKPGIDSEEQHINVLEFLAIVVGVWMASTLLIQDSQALSPQHCWQVLVTIHRLYLG